MVNSDAAQTLQQVERIRRSTRAVLDYPWVPFVVFGAITVGSAALTNVWDGAAVGVWWFVLGPAGLAITWRYYRGRELSVGFVDRREHLYTALLGAMFLVAFALGFAGGGDLLSDVGPTYAVGAGLLGVAAIDRSAIVACCGAAQLVLAFAVTITEPSHSGPLMALAGGGILVLTGLLIRRRGPSAP